MADYPVRDGNGDIIIAFEKDPALGTGYPALDGNGNPIIASAQDPNSAEGYPTRDGNGNIIIAFEKDPNLAPGYPSTTPTSMQISVTDPSTGHVFTFSEEREVGQYWNGEWFVVAGEGNAVEITSITPVSTSVSTAAYGLPDNLNDTATVGAQTRWMHGTMVNPWGGVAASSDADTGFDNYYGSNGNGVPYAHSANQDPGATGSNLTLTEGSVVKAESFTSEGGHTASAEDKTRILKMSVLTVVSEVPAANSFRPGPRAPSKAAPGSFTSDAALDARLDAIRPKISGFRPFTTTGIDTVAARIKHFQQTFMPYQEQARRINPGARGHAIDIYGSNWYFYFKYAMAAFVGDYTNAEVREIIKATIQVGVDIYGLLQDDSYYFPWQAHHAGRKGIVVMAGLVLNDQDILDQCDYDLHPEHFGVDDAYCGYVTSEMVGVQPRFYKEEYQFPWTAEQVGIPEWSVVFTDGDAVTAGDVSGSDQVVNSSILTRSYQVLSFDNGAMYQALFGVLVDPTAQYYNEAYFDFIDRYLAYRFGDQIHGDFDVSGDGSSTNGVTGTNGGNWWSINPSDTEVSHFQTMRNASSRPNAIGSMVPEALPKPDVTHDGSSPHLDVDFNSNNIQLPRNADATITGYDLRWTAYAGGADTITSQDDAAWVGNFEWNVIEDVTLPYELTGVPRGLKVLVQLRMKNVNGNGPWIDDRYRENYTGGGAFSALAQTPIYATRFDVPDTAAFNTIPQNFALPTISPASVVTGEQISGDVGIWSTNPTISATAYQWQVSDDGVTGWADISGATSINFTPTASEESKHVRLGAQRTNSEGTSAWVYSALTTAVSEPLVTEGNASAHGTGAFDPGFGALGGKRLILMFTTWNSGGAITLGGTVGAYSFSASEALFARNSTSDSGAAEVKLIFYVIDVPGGETATTISFTHSDAANASAAYELDGSSTLTLSSTPTFQFDGSTSETTVAGGMAFFMGKSDGSIGFTSSSELTEHTDSAADATGKWVFAHSFATVAGTATVNFSQGASSNTQTYLLPFSVS